MITIAEPKELIDKLWGKQKIREDDTYRLMRYVLRVDHEDKVLLHNVVTGRLVVLEREEAEALETLPSPYSPVMEQMVTEHFLVSEDYDEYQQVVNLRTILRTINAAHEKKHIRQYVILPTTLCNARCYYCFEQGIKSSTMSVETANEVVEFIASNYDNNSISIMWFGGEPTVACDRIDQISEGLQQKNIQYTSTMISNGYLFDEKMIAKARTLWKLKRVQITVDGLEEHYNKIKNYVNPCDNPFERVMRNIEMLLNAGIQVDLRMNFDKDNFEDFQNLVKLALTRFKGSRLLQMYAYPVIGEYPRSDGTKQHGSEDWAADKMIELNDIARKSGAHRYSDELPYLTHVGCGAEADNAITINAQGCLIECPERFDESQTVGTVRDGIQDAGRVQLWKELADYSKCVACSLYPRCMRLRACSAKDRCLFLDRNAQYRRAMITRLQLANQ